MIYHWSNLRVHTISNISQILTIFFPSCFYSVDMFFWNIYDNSPFHYANMFINQSFVNSFSVFLFCMICYLLRLLRFYSNCFLYISHICFICVVDFTCVINICFIRTGDTLSNTSGWKYYWYSPLLQHFNDLPIRYFLIWK